MGQAVHQADGQLTPEAGWGRAVVGTRTLPGTGNEPKGGALTDVGVFQKLPMCALETCAGRWHARCTPGGAVQHWVPRAEFLRTLVGTA